MADSMLAKVAGLRSYLQVRNPPAGENNFNDYAITLTANVLAQICLVVTGVLTARLLGPAGKGDLTTVLFLPSFMLSVGILSLPQSVALHIGRNSSNGDMAQATGFWMSLGLGVVEAAILYPLLPSILGTKSAPIVLMSKACLIYLPIAFSGFTLLGVAQGYQRFKKYNLLKHLPTFIYAFFLISLAILRSATITGIVIGFLFSQLVATAILVVSSGRRLVFPARRAWANQGKSIMRQGLVYSMPALSGIVLMRTDLAVLIRTVSATEVGFYSAALSIAMGQNMITSSIIQVNFPKVCGAGQEKCAAIILGQLKKSIAPIIVTGLLVAVSSPLIIRYLLGSSFSAAQNIAWVLIAAILVWCIGQVIDNGLRGAGLGYPSTFAYLGGIASLIAGASYFVPKYGALGMAIAFFIAQVLTTATLLLFLGRFVKKMQPRSSGYSGQVE